MTALDAALRRIKADLDDLGATYALVGGPAVSARTEPRFTRDADLAVAAAEDAEAERVIHQLQVRGFRVEATVEQDARTSETWIGASSGNNSVARPMNASSACSRPCGWRPNCGMPDNERDGDGL